MSVWTWAIADYEVEAMAGLMANKAIVGARLVVDRSCGATQRADHRGLARAVRRRGGRVCKNHAKMARVWTAERRVLIRGSMNLNFNPRFEQADITEGGEDFDLVQRIEDELPVLRPMCSNAEAESASKLSLAFEASELAMFAGVKPWSIGTRRPVVAALVEAGTRRDLAVQYADAFLEYREASKNISEHGRHRAASAHVEPDRESVPRGARPGAAEVAGDGQREGRGVPMVTLDSPCSPSGAPPAARGGARRGVAPVAQRPGTPRAPAAGDRGGGRLRGVPGARTPRRLDAPGLRLVLGGCRRGASAVCCDVAEGLPVGGYVVERLGQEGGAVIWRVVKVSFLSF